MIRLSPDPRASRSGRLRQTNLSAGAQNITGACVIIMLICRRLLTTRLPGKAAV